MEGSRRKHYAGMALAAICIGYLAPNYAQYQLSPLATSLMGELSISASQFSSLFTAPMIPAILLSLVAGFWLISTIRAWSWHRLCGLDDWRRA